MAEDNSKALFMINQILVVRRRGERSNATLACLGRMGAHADLTVFFGRFEKRSRVEIANAMGSIRPAMFDGVVRRFFEAAAVPDLWPQALHDLALACGAPAAVAIPLVGNNAAAVIASRDGAGVIAEGLRTGWFAPDRNTRMARCMALVQRGRRDIITQQDAYSVEDLARDPFHNEYIVPNGYSTFCGAVLAAAPGLALTVSIERAVGEDFFMRNEVALMNELVGHLRGAGELATRIGMASTQRMADAFSAAGHPIALLARDGSVIHMNARFERLVGDGVLLRAGQLGSWHSDADRAFAAAINRAIRFEGMGNGPLTSVVLPRQSGLRPLVAQVVPVVGMAHDVLHLVSAIVTLTDLESAGSGPAEAVLEQAFGLTPAEARLASQIAAGKTLADVALQDGSARETLRSRLKSVFDKTGTGRQAELTLLLSKIAPR
jgi:DNA-binding CsgD family transcriptional regulator/PAS domain-containing protein